jgi:hypothetical protein
MEVIYRYYKILFRVKLNHTTSEVVTLLRSKYGKLLMIYSMDYVLYKTKKYCIVTLRALMCSLFKMWPN